MYIYVITKSKIYHLYIINVLNYYVESVIDIDVSYYCIVFVTY